MAQSDSLRWLARFAQNGSVAPLADIPPSLQAGFIEALQTFPASVRFRGILNIRGVVTRASDLMSIIARCGLGMRVGVLGIAVLLVLPMSVSVAQSVPVLGYVAAQNANPERLEVFKRGLTELGYIEGKNIRIDYREAVLDGEYRGVMAELVGRKVSIILAANVAAAVAAAKATTSIPIVMLAVNDPVGLGLVKSLDHPGTNVTGRRGPPIRRNADESRRPPGRSRAEHRRLSLD